MIAFSDKAQKEAAKRKEAIQQKGPRRKLSKREAERIVSPKDAPGRKARGTRTMGIDDTYMAKPGQLRPLYAGKISQKFGRLTSKDTTAIRRKEKESLETKTLSEVDVFKAAQEVPRGKRAGKPDQMAPLIDKFAIGTMGDMFEQAIRGADFDKTMGVIEKTYEDMLRKTLDTGKLKEVIDRTQKVFEDVAKQNVFTDLDRALVDTFKEKINIIEQAIVTEAAAPKKPVVEGTGGRISTRTQMALARAEDKQRKEKEKAATEEQRQYDITEAFKNLRELGAGSTVFHYKPELSEGIAQSVRDATSRVVEPIVNETKSAVKQKKTTAAPDMSCCTKVLAKFDSVISILSEIGKEIGGIGALFTEGVAEALVASKGPAGRPAINRRDFVRKMGGGEADPLGEGKKAAQIIDDIVTPSNVKGRQKKWNSIADTFVDYTEGKMQTFDPLKEYLNVSDMLKLQGVWAGVLQEAEQAGTAVSEGLIKRVFESIYGYAGTAERAQPTPTGEMKQMDFSLETQDYPFAKMLEDVERRFGALQNSAREQPLNIFGPSLEQAHVMRGLFAGIQADFTAAISAIQADIETQQQKLGSIAEVQGRGSLEYQEQYKVLQLLHEKLIGIGQDLDKNYKTANYTTTEMSKWNPRIQNTNKGLTTTGRQLHNTSRLGELFNRALKMGAYQLVRWMNPINAISKGWQGWVSSNTKLQRTFKVISYNLQAMIRPMMEWITQKLVNLIGLVNSLLKGLTGGKVDLFDKSAASAEKMRQELEKATNVTAGFDELHDISSGDAAEDLSGDIYTPETGKLNEVFENIGEWLGKIKDMISGWNFWDWLLVIGGALAGFALLKAIWSWITKGTTPLQTAANALNTLAKGVAWALIIWAFAELVKALTDFITVVKDLDGAQIGKVLGVLAGSLLAVAATFVIFAAASKLMGLDALGIGMTALALGGFALLILAISGLVEAVKGMQSNDIAGFFIILAGSLIVVAAAFALLAAISTIFAPVIPLVALIIAAFSLFILTLSVLVLALGVAGEGIKKILEGIAIVVATVAEAIVKVIEGIANAIAVVLDPILGFIDSVIGKILDLAGIIVQEIGQTIRTIIETTGRVIVNIIHELVGAIPRLLDSVLRFVQQIGPAIAGSVDSILGSITKLINFTISGIEYLINTLVIGTINAGISKVTFGAFPNVFSQVSIPRFVPKYEKGTNYVPNDGLAYLHQGEAVVPKKYNENFDTSNPALERVLMKLESTIREMDALLSEGINVSGEFVQRGRDLVATVDRTRDQMGNMPLSNAAYVR